MPYKPKSPFNVAAHILTPEYKIVKAVRKKIFVPEKEPFYCSFKSFGGTETQVNGVTVVEDTAELETWYNPAIESDKNIRVNNKDYEILGTPENIDMRNQFMKFKVRAVKGGA